MGVCGKIHAWKSQGRYYGFYSNVSRGKRKKQDLDDIIPSILEPEGSSKAFRKNWARLIQKTHETDPFAVLSAREKRRF
jgi:hypothetical protein